MSQNIFQVINELNLDELLNKNCRNLIVIMLGSKNCVPCKTFKPKFIELSKKNSDVFFIYIDRENYSITENKYFAKYEYTPTILYFVGRDQIDDVEGLYEAQIIGKLDCYKLKIQEKRIEYENIENKKKEELKRMEKISTEIVIPIISDNDTIKDSTSVLSVDLIEKKIIGLNKLRQISELGGKLTKAYNLDSEYDEILFEIRFQTDTEFRKYILANTQQVVQPTKSELERKQMQVKQIKELDLLNQQMQMQSFQKLQQLRGIKQFKEEQEMNSRRELS
jgi:thiol-disulfide isomerase/thioredoxin